MCSVCSIQQRSDGPTAPRDLTVSSVHYAVSSAHTFCTYGMLFGRLAAGACSRELQYNIRQPSQRRLGVVT